MYPESFSVRVQESVFTKHLFHQLLFLQIRHGIKRLLTLGALEEQPDPAEGSLPKSKRMRTEKAKGKIFYIERKTKNRV